MLLTKIPVFLYYITPTCTIFIKNSARLPKSLYRSCAGRYFYGTENEIWAGFGLVGNTEKRLGADYEQLLRVFFSCFQGQKNFF